MRLQNFYADSDQTATQSAPYGQQLTYAIGHQVWQMLLTSSDFENRHQAVLQFNGQNRWRKRGISMIPMKYGVSYTFLTGNQGGALLTVCESDGTVIIATGGVEMGQGLETKLVQIAAEFLGIDMSLIQPVQTATGVVPNAVSTGASTGADLNGGAVKLAAEDLKTRLQQWCAANETTYPEDQELADGMEQSLAADRQLRVSGSAGSLRPGPLRQPGSFRGRADTELERDAVLLLHVVGGLLRGRDRRSHRRVHDPALGHPVRRR